MDAALERALNDKAFWAAVKEYGTPEQEADLLDYENSCLIFVYNLWLTGWRKGRQEEMSRQFESSVGYR